ncbi:hypothetical protein D5018_03830 [Parashewanella curva]|uniref:Uncharacterized protein n=1 Tax=Parashewanella curva TaxID=2338552 RepID=A0A3L8Q035_9GAMM|nr:hypothetical protein [Parashewanella curva]RLV60981.1 hypothetical protein D5018_03830 [Parashewanella curva]
MAVNTDYATSGVIPTETPEEHEVFVAMAEKMLPDDVREQRHEHILKMTKVGLQCPTHSVMGICALLYDAGCRLPGEEKDG